ncbi:MAG TPA: hypothetical protein DCF48_01055, partial [Rikenellaceae bacterium]|nr:hypothetical protein [Rikenellaceae bacterium]
AEGLEEITSIEDLKALYKTGPVTIDQNIWIKGKVISSDKSGNIYNEMYIQDGKSAADGSAITLKLGKSSLYNEYPVGSWVYVKCQHLTLGAYNGMLQLGMGADQTATNEYETSYINLQAIIDAHVFRGFQDEPFAPVALTEDALKAAVSAGASDKIWGKVVTLKGCVYGDQIFALFYPNSNMAHKSGNPENRVFLSDNGTWGVDTWACTKAGYIGYLQSGVWDQAEVGSGATRYGSILGTPSKYLGEDADKFGADAFLTYKEIMIKYAAANYISHYFKLGGTDVQVRTSGYAKFADTKLSSGILEKKPVTITGIITLYDGSAQISLVDDPEISVILQ